MSIDWAVVWMFILTAKSILSNKSVITLPAYQIIHWFKRLFTTSINKLIFLCL